MTRILKSCQNPDPAGCASGTNGHPPGYEKGAKTHVVPASRGYAFEVKKGDHFRVVDLHGQQVVDFAAWVLPDMKEKLSMAYTRMRLLGVTPMVGECLLTNKDEPIFRLVEDTVKVHDMTFPSCFPEMYEKRGVKGHRSCATNIIEAMEPYGMKSYLEVTDPFNIFQNTPNYTIKALNSSKPGDYVEFEALKDAVCVVSCCPYDLVGPELMLLVSDIFADSLQDGFNGGKITDVAVVTGIKREEGNSERGSDA
jgi:uncharacterized protein